MNLTITPGAATEDATQIDQIVTEMEQQMDELNSTIKRDIPEAMAEMKLSASNLRLAVEQALQYDQERN